MSPLYYSKAHSKSGTTMLPMFHLFFFDIENILLTSPKVHVTGCDKGASLIHSLLWSTYVRGDTEHNRQTNRDTILGVN